MEKMDSNNLPAISFKNSFFIMIIPLLLFVNSIFYWLYVDQKKRETFVFKIRAENSLLRQKEMIGKFADDIFNDLNVILNHHELLDLIDKEQYKSRKNLVHDLIQFARFKGVYDQIRYIDEQGMEKIRINFNDGHSESVGKEKLQNKKDRYYFKDSIKLNKNEIFMSPMDLNIEMGKIELPLKPMIRISTPIFNKHGEKKGIVIVNYLSKNLLNALSDEKAILSTRLMMLNRNGYFLKGMSKDEEWGFMYEDKKHLTFENKFQETWRIIISSDKGTFINKFGLFSFTTIFPMKEKIKSSSGAPTAFGSSKKTVNSNEYQWKLVYFITKVDFNQKLETFKKNIVILDVVISSIIILIIWFLALFSHRKKQADIKLKIAHDELEIKVKERTADLRKEITERKETEGELLESEEKYRSMMESMKDPVYICSPDYLIEYANPAMLKRIGRDVTGESCFNAMHNLKEKCPWCMHNKILKGKQIELEIDSPLDNCSYHITNSPIVHTNGSISKMTVFRNITDRKKMQKALKEASSIINRSPAVVFLWENNQGWPVEFVSENVKKMFGYSSEEFTSGKVSYVDIIHPDDLQRVAGEVSTYSNKKDKMEVVHKPYRIVTRKGDIKWLDDKTVIRKDPKGIITHYEGIVIDITDHKKIEEEKKELSLQFQQAQKMESIGVLAGGVAHDFNNILSIIIGNADLALMDAGVGGSLQGEIKEIKIAGERGASLTRQLLAFSRKQIIQPKILNLNKLLEGIEKMLGRLIGEDVEILKIPEPALWQVKIDPGQMEQVIMNLAINARDAMRRGGKLTIETSNEDIDENYFYQHGFEGEPGSYVMLTVSDTGIGMDRETQKHIFEPFYTTKKKGEGTGLGLSTIYGIIKQNNGFVWVYSEPGQGSTFKVYLPRSDEGVVTEKKEKSPVIELGGSETILIAEDDDNLRSLVRTILKKKGYTVLTAENGEAALRVNKEHDGQIDLLLTDVIMPKMDGEKTAKLLEPRHPRMKTIYMSGYTDNAIVYHGILEAGLNFLQKPFSSKDLMRIVREILDKE